MTKEEAIKYLQQLYPNGGHCWLDEQRIEAIGMAVKALQEEPVSEDLEQEIINYIGFPQEVDEDISTTMIRKAAIHFAKWQKEKMMKSVIASQECKYVQVCHRLIGGSWNLKCPTDKLGLSTNDRLKVYIIKEDEDMQAKEII